MRAYFLVAMLALGSCASSRPRRITEPLMRDLPSAEGECFMVQALGAPELYVSNPQECAIPTSPASTFKIPHALIALSTRVVTDPLAQVKWDGTPQPFPSWERDHSLDSAIKSSVVWFFRRTANSIGRERMQEWLRRLQYGSDMFDDDPTYFWLNGDLVISPQEQLEFLVRLFRNVLPVEKKYVDAVTAALKMPSGKISNAAGVHDFPLAWPSAEVRAKTGNTRVGDERVSWLVGKITVGSEEYVFVSRIRAAQALPTTAGAEVALKHLNALRPSP